jgi:hypothetical protein
MPSDSTPNSRKGSMSSASLLRPFASVAVAAGLLAATAGPAAAASLAAPEPAAGIDYIILIDGVQSPKDQLSGSPN